MAVSFPRGPTGPRAFLVFLKVLRDRPGCIPRTGDFRTITRRVQRFRGTPGRQVWVRQETRLLRLYNTRREQIALHALAEPGKFTTDPAHLHSRKRHIIERGADYLLDRCRMIGPLTGT